MAITITGSYSSETSYTITVSGISSDATKRYYAFSADITSSGDISGYVCRGNSVGSAANKTYGPYSTSWTYSKYDRRVILYRNTTGSTNLFTVGSTYTQAEIVAKSVDFVDADFISAWVRPTTYYGYVEFDANGGQNGQYTRSNTRSGSSDAGYIYVDYPLPSGAACSKTGSSTSYDATYQVSFNANGGTSVSPRTPKRTETTTYTFDGFSNLKSATSASYKIGQNYPIYCHSTDEDNPTKNTIYAVYDKHVDYGQFQITLPSTTRSGSSGYTNRFTITFDANGGTASSTSERTHCSYETSYYLLGWYLNSTNVGTPGDIYYAGSAVTLKAEWYQDTIYGPSTLTQLPTATRAYRTFDGWYTAREGGSLISTSTQFTSDTTVYAHWSRPSYVLSYNANGGYPYPVGGTYYYGDTVTLNAALTKDDSTPEFYKTVRIDFDANGGTSAQSYITRNVTKYYSYLFSSWRHNNTDYPAGYSFTMPNDNVTMNAIYSETTHYIHPSITLPSATKDGYQLLGWYNSYGDKVGDAGDPYTVSVDETLKAWWEPAYHFDWDAPKVSGQPFNVTANEWVRYGNTMRQRFIDEGRTPPTFRSITAGVTVFSKEYWNDFVDAVNTIHPGSMTHVSSGDIVYASGFSTLKNKLNT